MYNTRKRQGKKCGINKKYRSNKHNKVEYTCIICGKKFLSNCTSKVIKTCSKECCRQYRRDKNPNKESLQVYRHDCAFTFALNDFPDEFDFSLIEKYGWYKAANRGNNLNGVSRDHMYSVKDGFINNVDPKIISHPANCKLVLQRYNSSKYSKSSITLEQLMDRIQKWDIKYNK